jgi:RimJ/RimL family protein N-acetyltransferase
VSGFAIETERLILREWRPEDTEPFHRHLNTPAVMRWLGGIKSREYYDSIVLDRFIPWQKERGFTLWAVERRADKALLGFCGLKISSEPGSKVNGAIEAAWRLREDVWGQGFAKEAARAAFDFAFDSLAAERVVALTVDGNKPSWGLMERLGMRRRPDLDFEGADWADGVVIVYEMPAEEWRR